MTATENITRDEARLRAELIRVHGYHVHLDLTSSGPTFPSTTTAEFAARVTGASTWIDCIAERVDSIVLNGRNLDPATAVQGSRILLTDLAAENTVTITADARYMNTGEGLHRFVDPVDGETYLYTQFESADARRVYACFEQPDLKACFTLVVDAPAHWTVLSNTTGVRSPGPNETALWTFPTTPRLPTYITAVVAGPYHGVHDSYRSEHGDYPLGVYCRASLAQYLDADDILLLTKQGFAFFEESFQLHYPFTKYDQIFVPEFNAGAMENAACVTFLEDYVFRSRVTDAAYEQRANTILHEMAHMWFGDLVTMRWWDDLWLNESFAEWAAHDANARATRYQDAWTTFANVRKSWAYRQDQLPSTHPIAADMVDLDSVQVNFDGITYAKGASALRQLVAWVGDEAFVQGVRRYFTKHAWGNTELTDLLVELEATSGRDLSGWAAEWLQTSGVNLLRAEVATDADGVITEAVVLQEPPTVPPGLPPILRSHRIGIGLYDLVERRLIRRTRIDTDVVGSRTSVPELVGQRRPDLLLLNDGDFTFAKVRLDEQSWRTAVETLGTIDDSLARAIIWSAAWDMTRDAEVATGDYLALVEQAIGQEADIAAVQVILRQLRLAIDLYAAPERRSAYGERLARLARELAEAAEAGSDRQLAFTRAFIQSATTTADLDLVSGLLTGEVVWAGLTVDTDLRWFMVQRLAATGRVDDTRISEELASDDTAAGRRHAAVARAAIGRPEAKERAWKDVVEAAEDLPNAMIMATVLGFMQADQRDLLRPYRDRYFEALPSIWASRTTEIAQDLAVGLFPALLVEQETITAAEQFLATERPPSMQRLVGEGKDAIRRALLAQQRDRG